VERLGRNERGRREKERQEVRRESVERREVREEGLFGDRSGSFLCGRVRGGGLGDRSEDRLGDWNGVVRQRGEGGGTNSRIMGYSTSKLIHKPRNRAGQGRKGGPTRF